MEQYVAPLVGAWIEIFLLRGETTDYIRSLPLWERGLKSLHWHQEILRILVAPLVGAWIEMITCVYT